MLSGMGQILNLLNLIKQIYRERAEKGFNRMAPLVRSRDKRVAVYI